ncbi:hypothetical protein HDU93_004959 [Gonapodya sp. JEL0774]|nr:hypothetical protein HDU93_004959 [Gonapodya sp. JEL0774]
MFGAPGGAKSGTLFGGKAVGFGVGSGDAARHQGMLTSEQRQEGREGGSSGASGVDGKQPEGSTGTGEWAGVAAPTWLDLVSVHPMFEVDAEKRQIPRTQQSQHRHDTHAHTNVLSHQHSTLAARGSDLFFCVPGTRSLRALNLQLLHSLPLPPPDTSLASSPHPSVISHASLARIAASAPHVILSPTDTSHPSPSKHSRKPATTSALSTPHSDNPELDFDPTFLSVNPTGRLLLAASPTALRVIVLPRSSSLLPSSFSTSTSSATSTPSTSYTPRSILCRSLPIGTFDLSTDPSCPIVQASWHPAAQGGTAVCVLTADGVFRIYDLSHSADLPEQTHQLVPNPALLPARSKRATSTASSFSSTAIPNPGLPAAFCFGFDDRPSSFSASPSTPSSDNPAPPPAPSRGIKPGDGWGALTVYCVTREGNVWALCPVIVGKSLIPPSLVHLLRRTLALPPSAAPASYNPDVPSLASSHPAPPSPTRPDMTPKGKGKFAQQRASKTSAVIGRSDADVSLEFLESVIAGGGEVFSATGGAEADDGGGATSLILGSSQAENRSRASDTPQLVSLIRLPKPATQGPITIVRSEPTASPVSSVSLVASLPGIIILALCYESGAVEVIVGGNVSGGWPNEVKGAGGGVGEGVRGKVGQVNLRRERDVMVFTPVKGGKEMRETPMKAGWSASRQEGRPSSGGWQQQHQQQNQIQLQQDVRRIALPPRKKKRRGWGLHSDSEDEDNGREMVALSPMTPVTRQPNGGHAFSAKSSSDEDGVEAIVIEDSEEDDKDEIDSIGDSVVESGAARASLPTWTVIETVLLPLVSTSNVPPAGPEVARIVPESHPGTAPRFLVATGAGVFEISVTRAVRAIRVAANKVVQGGEPGSVLNTLHSMTDVRACATMEDDKGAVGVCVFEGAGVRKGLVVVARDGGVAAVSDSGLDEVEGDAEQALIAGVAGSDSVVPLMATASTDIHPDAYRSLLEDVERFHMPRHLRENVDRPRPVKAGRPERSDEEMVKGIGAVVNMVRTDAGRIQEDGIVTEGRLMLIDRELDQQTNTISAVTATLTSEILPTTSRITNNLASITKRQIELRARADRVLSSMWHAVRKAGAGGQEMAEWESEMEVAGQKAEWMGAQTRKLVRQYEILKQDLERQQAPRRSVNTEMSVAVPDPSESRDGGRNKGNGELGSVQEARIKAALAHENLILVEAQEKLDTLQKEMDEAMAKLNI